MTQWRVKMSKIFRELRVPSQKGLNSLRESDDSVLTLLRKDPPTN